MNYKVHTTKRFDKESEKLSNEYRRRIENLFIQLSENPFIGDQLQIKSLREKRLEEKRILYLVFEDLKAVLVIAISGKRAQQKVINFILNNIDNFKKGLKE